MAGSPLPQHGLPADEVADRLSGLQADDVRWQDGRAFTLAYNAGPDVQAVAEDALRRFMTENALNTDAFPSLRRIQHDVVAIVAGWLDGGPEAAGFMTTGGTESILLAVEGGPRAGPAERDVAPTQRRAADLGPRRVREGRPLLRPREPPRPGARATGGPTSTPWPTAIDDDTVLVVGSAPQYPQGVIDPIAEIAALAGERGINCHVDACMGGVMLPYLARLGDDVPPWTSRVPGVTSHLGRPAQVRLHGARALR